MDNGVNFSNFCRICMLSVTDENTFKSFKRNPIYTGILEHVSYEQGLLYIEEIKRNNPQLLNKEFIDRFKMNDLIGNPVTFDYGFTVLSPTILRYINVLSDLISLFGDLSNMKIIEIGAGNGGQCSIISKVFKFKEYIMVDLHEVVELQRKCINAMHVENVRFLIKEFLDNTEYDLVISNYAFSECPDNIKQLYIDKILLNSKRGYLTMNRESETHYKETIINVLKSFNPTITEEKPQTAQSNYIITWGTKQTYVSDDPTDHIYY